jgi:hypothetical protein
VVAGVAGDGQSNQLPWACLRWTKIAPARPAFVAVSMNRPPAIGASHHARAEISAPNPRPATSRSGGLDTTRPQQKSSLPEEKIPAARAPRGTLSRCRAIQTGAEQPTESLMTSDCRVKPVTIAFAIQATRRPPSPRRHLGRWARRPPSGDAESLRGRCRPALRRQRRDPDAVASAVQSARNASRQASADDRFPDRSFAVPCAPARIRGRLPPHVPSPESSRRGKPRRTRARDGQRITRP